MSTVDRFLLACGDKSRNTCSKATIVKRTIFEEIKEYKRLVIAFFGQEKTTVYSCAGFWKQYYRELPLLSGLAKNFLSVCGTSVPSESAFSLSAYLGRKQRARLSQDVLAYSVFLKDKI